MLSHFSCSGGEDASQTTDVGSGQGLHELSLEGVPFQGMAEGLSLTQDYSFHTDFQTKEYLKTVSLAQVLFINGRTVIKLHPSRLKWNIVHSFYPLLCFLN